MAWPRLAAGTAPGQATNVRVDWNEEAAEAAQDYLDMMPSSRAGLIEQLTSSYGHQFIPAQAKYGVNSVGL